MINKQHKIGDILYIDHTTGDYRIVNKIDKENNIETCIASEYEYDEFKYENFENSLFYKKEDYEDCLIYRIENNLEIKVEELKELADGYEFGPFFVEQQDIEEEKWTILTKTIIKLKGRYFSILWSRSPKGTNGEGDYYDKNSQPVEVTLTEIPKIIVERHWNKKEMV